MLEEGYPAYVTSAGWLGYDDDTIRERCRAAIAEGWRHFKIKVGRDLQDDIRRCRIVREEIGDDRKLMVDANQVWDVDQAIEHVRHLAPFDLWWVEEPTHPDDVLGHARISEAIAPIRVATGEHCHNRIMVKQLLQARAVQVLQIDGCRLGGINEVIASLLLAEKFDVPVCPHAGGVGLCEHVQHFSVLDYIAVSGTLENRITEFADHLHEHFVQPVRMKDGHYVLPEAPGLGVEFVPKSLADYSFPDGAVCVRDSPQEIRVMPADDHRLTTAEIARFVAEGYLRFDALVPEDVNERVIAELQALASVKLQQAIGREVESEVLHPESLTPLSQCYPEPSVIGEYLRLPQIQGIVTSLVGKDPLFDHDFVHQLPAGSQYRQHLHVDAVIDDPSPAFDIQIFYYPGAVQPGCGARAWCRAATCEGRERRASPATSTSWANSSTAGRPAP